MKKTVVFMGSPRKHGNTDILTNRVIEGLQSTSGTGDAVEKIDLIELKDYVCCACVQCRKAGECVQFPKVTKVLEKIREADGIVLATPTWWLGPSSYMKIFIDHWGAFLRSDYSSRIVGKRAVIVACCGNPDINLSEKVCKDLEQILQFLKVNVVGTLGVKGVAELGVVAKDKDALDAAFSLGARIYKD